VGWVDNIKMDLREGEVVWIGVLRVGAGGEPFECGNKPSASIICSGTIEWLHN
jgi:hypothetical protein